MLTHSPIQSGLSWSMRGGAQVLVGSLGVALLTVSIIIGLEVSVAAARSGVEPSGNIVNRTLKGHRLPLVPVKHLEINIPLAPAAVSELADGCESLVSPLAHSRLANIARRCVS
jgi:hypothetical protein